MGWYGEVSEGLKIASKNVDEYPRNSLGWLLAVGQWNHWVSEATSEGNKWEEIGLPKDQMPKNCEWEDPEEVGFPIIKIPQYDKYQTLRVEI